jgi:hypothetical protein
MTEDQFLERVRQEAARLRYEPDDVAAGRISARVRDRIAQPTVATVLALWFRPIAATLSVLTIAAALTFTLLDRSDDQETLQIEVAGEEYVVGN